ncbi:MAG: aminotransferase class I/II-fold pyridoxal phosphate-dependent enzyme [Prevotellaceae bacterium]|nr:aminotransferase class I/II-fold pyridoxal phosphate-dependent enzyme [Prevotellaceae bacterium]
MKPLSNRTATFTDSVIRRMTRISNEYGAINLSQGFPDFDPPRPLTDRLAEVAHEGPHQYAITWGAKNFRDALAAKQSRLTGLPIDPERNVVVTCGSTEAMMAAMMTVVNPGDKVVIFSPFYENYSADTILSGAEPVFIPLVPPTFTFDADKLEDAFRAGAKALVLCNPSNPCGKVFTRAELEQIADIVRRYDGYVITDEVYEHIVYAPHHHIYISTLPSMWERTVSCSSLSKTYSITGWRLGYVIAPEAIIERVKKVHDFLTVGAAAPLMEAATVGLRFGDDYYNELRDHYTHMRALFCNGLRDLGLDFTEPQGAYYVLLDMSRYGVTDDLHFCEWLAREVGVGAVPCSCFFREDVRNLVRLHFAKRDETLIAALDRLSGIDKKARTYRK